MKIHWSIYYSIQCQHCFKSEWVQNKRCLFKYLLKQQSTQTNKITSFQMHSLENKVSGAAVQQSTMTHQTSPLTVTGSVQLCRIILITHLITLVPHWTRKASLTLHSLYDNETDGQSLRQKVHSLDLVSLLGCSHTLLMLISGLNSRLSLNVSHSCTLMYSMQTIFCQNCCTICNTFALLCLVVTEEMSFQNYS